MTMHDSPPLVSTIIPVYDGERYLAQAIESVLAQTYRPTEVIVVDDGSTDGSARVAKGFAPAVRYCFQSNAGAAVARNRGVALATGRFFAFLDADDRWMENKLALQMEAFGRDPQLDMAFGHIIQFRTPDPAEGRQLLESEGEPMPGFSVCTMLVKRESFFRVGPFARRWRLGEFVDWYSRAQEKGLRHLMLPEVVTRRRLHTANMGIREQGSHPEYARILKAALDRRRAGGPRHRSAGPAGGNEDDAP
jgi:glycosyltransferase involved in cell wall biosynthesis